MAPATARPAVEVVAAKAEDPRQHEATNERERGEPRVVGDEADSDGAAHRNQTEERPGWTEVHGESPDDAG
jgi:hypothetical protein